MKNLLLFCCCFWAAQSFAQIAPLNFSDPSNWSAHPMKLFDLAIKPSYTIIGADTTQRTQVNFVYPPINAPADIFVVSPTTLISAGNLPRTTPLDFVQKSAINFAIQLNFSYLGQIGRIYAPYYRQANLATFSMPLNQENTQAAIFDTAATDALAAFKYYMDHNNGGRRVILAGHSQGALVIAMMLRRMEKDPAQYGTYMDQIFLSVLAGMEGGAYSLKNNLSGGWLETIPFCENAADTACLMAWQTVKEGLLFNSNIPFGNNIPFNESMEGKGLKFKAFDPNNYHQWGDPLGFSEQQKPVERAIFPKIYIATGATGINSDWVAYDGMYEARILKPNASTYAISVEKTSNASDQRHDPIAGALFADLHLYDMYFEAGDVLRLIKQKLAGVSSTPENVQADLSTILFPNPGATYLQVKGNSAYAEYSIFNLQGQLLWSGDFDNNIDIQGLIPGLYFLVLKNKAGIIQWKSSFVKH